MELISKQGLLKEAGISYGQLYRWKRQGLIPESWFIKRAVPSGQATFLPRKQALMRIAKILEKKESTSLKSMAEHFEIDSDREFGIDELIAAGVERGLFRRMDSAERFGIDSAVYFHVLGRAVNDDRLPMYLAAGLAKTGIAAGAAAEGAWISVFSGSGGYHAVITKEPPGFDNSVNVIAQYETESSRLEIAAILDGE